MYNTVTFRGEGGLREEFFFEGSKDFSVKFLIFPLDDKAVLNMRQSVLGELLCISC